MLTGFIIFAVLFNIAVLLIIRGGSAREHPPIIPVAFAFIAKDRFDCLDGFMFIVTGVLVGQGDYQTSAAIWLCWFMVRVAIAFRRRDNDNTAGAAEGAFPADRFEGR